MRKVDKDTLLDFVGDKMPSHKFEEEIDKQQQEKKEEIVEVKEEVKDEKEELQGESKEEKPKEELQSKNKEEVTRENEDDYLSKLKEKYNIEDKKEEEGEEKEANEDSSLKDEKEEFDINSVIAEKTQGKFNTLEDLITATQNTESKETENQFASERIKKLNELEQNGVDIMKVLDVERLNVDNLSTESFSDGLSIIKAKMKLEDPELTDHEINALLKREYMFDEDVDDEDVINYKKAKLKREAKRSKQDIIDYKKKLELPNPKANSEAAQKEAQKQQEEYNEMFRNEINNFNKNYSSESFKVTDDFSLDFGVTDEMKSKVANELQSPVDYWKRYTNDSGEFKIDDLVKERVIMDNLSLILRSVADQVKNQTARDIVSDLENARPKGYGKQTKSSANKSLHQKAFDKLKDEIFK